jgi:DNA-nicking Smr family endonuclease
MRKKDMSPDDRVLWGKVARSVRPLPGRMEDLEEFEATFEEVPKDVIAPAPASMDVVLKAGTTLTQPEKLKAAVQHHPIERPVKRKISKGRLALEARLDLHGLVQSEAHSMLLSFILRAHERGMRHVLVITGKGSSMGSEGALKRAVPFWFSKPEFRYLISGYEQASRNHGGDGALYVRLARRPGEK